LALFKSVTTSRHINKWFKDLARNNNINVEQIQEEEIDNILGFIPQV